MNASTSGDRFDTSATSLEWESDPGAARYHRLSLEQEVFLLQARRRDSVTPRTPLTVPPTT
jgi:hypothetical protein